MDRVRVIYTVQNITHSLGNQPHLILQNDHVDRIRKMADMDRCHCTRQNSVDRPAFDAIPLFLLMNGAVGTGPAHGLSGAQQHPVALGAGRVQALGDLDPQRAPRDEVVEVAVDVVDLAVLVADGRGGVAHLAQFGGYGGEEGGLVEAEDQGARDHGDVGEDSVVGLWGCGWGRCDRSATCGRGRLA